MKSSYKKEDVILLLKDITGQIAPMNAKEREKRIQSGVHYSTLLPEEYVPSEAYFSLFQEALKRHSSLTARAVGILSEKIYKEKGQDVVLVSLARAGTPVGILIKRYLEGKYHITVPHYSISIIRDRGIDKNAMAYLLKRYDGSRIQFVDGWIGKGAIIRELKKAMKEYPKVSPSLAVLADPARLTALYGTSEDFLIPSACLNAPVSGLFSRTVLNDSLIGKEDFHGSVYYASMENADVSYLFLETVEKDFDFKADLQSMPVEKREKSAQEEIKEICETYKIEDINFVKPGIGETTRVLMRRVPWLVLVKKKEDLVHIGHILRLCEEKEVQVVQYPLVNYRAVGLIQKLSDI